jgi:hypothetical protein
MSNTVHTTHVHYARAIDNRVERSITPQLPPWVIPHSRELSLPEHNNIEYVARLYNTVKRYFSRCRAHVYLNLNDAWDNTLYAYCDPRPIMDSVRFRVIDTVRLPRLTDYNVYRRLLYGRFFDLVAHENAPELSYQNDAHRPTTNRTAVESMILPTEESGSALSPFTTVVDAVKILMRVSTRFSTNSTERTVRGQNVLIGLYLPDKNILIVGDWSHSVYGVNYATHLFESVITRLDLLPMKKEVVRKRRRPRVSITLGSDPEFELINVSTGQVIYASGKLRSSSTQKGGIGVDGAGSQVELRPLPAPTPEEAVSNLKVLIERFYQLHPNYDLSVAGHRFPLGGHIHIGVGQTYEPPLALLKMLDDFIGEPTLNLSGRARGIYKRLGAKESKRWGFEYRTAPSVIFVTPEITRIAYKMAQNITSKFINSSSPFTYKYPITEKELVEIAGLTNEEAEYYLRFLTNTLLKVGGNSNRILLDWNSLINRNAITIPSNNAQYDEKETDEEVAAIPDSTNTLVITFRDDWELRIKNILNTKIRALLLAPRRLRDLQITFFGYRLNRGFASNISLDAPEELHEYLADVHRINEETAIANGAPPILPAPPTDTVFRLVIEHPVIVTNSGDRTELMIGLPNLYRQDISVARILTDLIVRYIEVLLIRHNAILATNEAQQEEVQDVCDSGV